MTAKQFAALSGVGLVWGASFLFVRVLLNAGVAPFGVSAARTAFGALAMLPFAFALRRQLPRSRRTWLAMAILGLLNFALPWTLFSFAGRLVPSGIGSITNSANPLLAAIVSASLFKFEPLTKRQIGGLVVGFLGVVALLGEDLANLGGSAPRAIALMLAAVTCYALSSASIRRWFSDVPSVLLAFTQVTFAAIYLAPIAYFDGSFESAHFGWEQWATLLALGAGGSGIAVVWYMWLIRNVGPVRASLVTYIIPPVGISLGWLVLDEPIGWNMLAGLVLILGGLALVQGVRLKRPARGPISPLAPSVSPETGGQ